MNDSKIISIVAIIIGALGIKVASDGKMSEFTEILLEKDNDNQLGKFALAFLVFLFIVSFLDDKSALLLAVVIVAGALIVERQRGKDTLSVLMS